MSLSDKNTSAPIIISSNSNSSKCSVVLPGDHVDLSKLHVKASKKLVLGPGLDKIGENVTCCKAGILKSRSDSGMVWIDNRQKRYVATKGDNIIGIVTAKQGDTFRVDIGASDPASLSYLSFENATKKNRPDVKIGDIVFGKLLVANKHMEPELVCIDSHGKSNGMGVIRDGGNLIHVNLHWVRRLLSKECQLMKLIGEQLPYESAIGVNGRIWVKGRSVEETLVIGDLLKNGDKLPNEMMKRFVMQTVNQIIGSKQ